MCWFIAFGFYTASSESHIERIFSHFLPYKIWSEGVVYHQLWVFCDMLFDLWPYAIFGVSHIEEISLPLRPYKHEPKKWRYPHFFSSCLITGGTLTFSAHAYKAWGGGRFLPYGTLQKLHKAKGEKACHRVPTTGGTLLLHFTAYKEESGGRFFRCGTPRMLCKSQKL